MSNPEPNTNPKVFISYRWTSEKYKERVLKLAEDLVESGVDVQLDRWHLREGDDTDKFMERMVADPNIKKVLILCDKAYVERANAREGGVGTETQIISKEVYQQQDENKFVAVVMEQSEDGKLPRPVYYGSRVYIDLSNQTTYSSNFDQLLRWIYSKPLHERPPLGSAPAFLNDKDNEILLATATRFRRAIDAIKENRPNVIAFINEYFDVVASEFEKMRLKGDEEPFDEAVIKSIGDFLPYRNQIIELFTTLITYRDTEDSRHSLHRFFEKLIPYLSIPKHVARYRKYDVDNYKFIIHELFLYAVAVSIKYEKFEIAAYLMSTKYYATRYNNNNTNTMISFVVFREYMHSLDARKQRLGSRFISFRAELLKERCHGTGIEFEHLMQADFSLFLRARVDTTDRIYHWWPETLLYARYGHENGAFEIFLRSCSMKYFDRIKVMLGVQDKTELETILNRLKDGDRLPIWDGDTLNLLALLAFDTMATEP